MPTEAAPRLLDLPPGAAANRKSVHDPSKSVDDIIGAVQQQLQIEVDQQAQQQAQPHANVNGSGHGQGKLLNGIRR